MIDKTIGKSGKKIQRTCQGCDETFIALAIKVRRGKEKYCSKQCYNLSRQKSKQENKYSTEKSHQLKYKYGITLEDFENMRTSQDNSCGICEVIFKGTPYVDHCHSTGKVRGLLCSNCNTGLGMFEDDVDRLREAIRYLGV